LLKREYQDYQPATRELSSRAAFYQPAQKALGEEVQPEAPAFPDRDWYTRLSNAYGSALRACSFAAQWCGSSQDGNHIARRRDATFSSWEQQQITPKKNVIRRRLMRDYQQHVS